MTSLYRGALLMGFRSKDTDASFGQDDNASTTDKSVILLPLRLRTWSCQEFDG